MTTQSPGFVLKAAGSRTGFLVAHPNTGSLVSREEVQSGYVYPPVLFPRAVADLLAESMARPGRVWEVLEAPPPCPHCGRHIETGDRDFCYAANRERTAWRAGCNVHNSGCGFEARAPSEAEVLARWAAGS